MAWIPVQAAIEADLFPRWVGEGKKKRKVSVAVRRAVLIAVAFHAHKDGTGAWAGVELMAEETGLTRRSVQYGLRSLEDEGILTRWADPSTDDGRRWKEQTWEYSIDLDALAALKPTKDERNARRRLHRQSRKQKNARAPDAPGYAPGSPPLAHQDRPPSRTTGQKGRTRIAGTSLTAIEPQSEPPFSPDLEGSSPAEGVQNLGISKEEAAFRHEVADLDRLIRQKAVNA